MDNYHKEELIGAAFHSQQMIFVVWWAYSWVTVRVVMFRDPRSRPLVWDWRYIDCDDIAFPENFSWGVASSSHQVSG